MKQIVHHLRTVHVLSIFSDRSIIDSPISGAHVTAAVRLAVQLSRDFVLLTQVGGSGPTGGTCVQLKLWLTVQSKMQMM